MTDVVPAFVFPGSRPKNRKTPFPVPPVKKYFFAFQPNIVSQQAKKSFSGNSFL